MEFEEKITNQIETVESSSSVLYEESQVPVEMPHDEEELKKLVHIRSTELAVTDDGLVGDLVGKKKEELKNSADAHLKQEKAENKKADIQLQEANYGVYSGVANYAGIKKPLPQKMQNILFSILSVFQTIFLIVFGIPISIINMLADGTDSVVKKLCGITKSAMWIVLLCLFVALVVLIVFLVKFLVSSIF
jgi:hypothetical protein